MKRIMISVALLACLVSGYVSAETYTYTGSNYSEAHGMYTTAMRTTGTITTSVPIPPNSSGLDISGILTSWSFFDGVQTINNLNGTFHPLLPQEVYTDAEGNITGYLFWANMTPISTTVGQSDDYIAVSTSFKSVAIDATCKIYQSPACRDWEEPVDRASSADQGIWYTGVPPIPPIPTLSQWTLMLLAMMLGLVGIARVRNHVRMVYKTS